MAREENPKRHDLEISAGQENLPSEEDGRRRKKRSIGEWPEEDVTERIPGFQTAGIIRFSDRRSQRGNDRVEAGIADGTQTTGQIEDFGDVMPELPEQVHVLGGSSVSPRRSSSALIWENSSS